MSAFYFSHYHFLSAPYHIIILSTNRFDHQSFMLSHIFAFAFRIIAFPLMGLRTPGFFNWFFSLSSSDWQAICRLWLTTSYFYSSVVIVVVVVASIVLYAMSTFLPTSLYPSILQLHYICKLLEMTFKIFTNDIEQNFIVCYSIKNPFYCLKTWIMRSIFLVEVDYLSLALCFCLF